MKATYAWFAAVLMLCSSPAGYAQGGSIAGKWTGELPAAQGRGASQPITVELRLEGQTLSGSVVEGALDPRPITNAAVEGSTFSFRTTQNFGGQDIVVNWFGEVKGDDLALTRGVGPTVEAPAGGGGRGGAGAAGGGGRGAAGGAAGGRGGAAAGGAPAGGARGAAPPPAAGQDGAARGADAPPAGAAQAGAARGGAQGGAAAGGGARGAGAAGAARGGAGRGAPPAAAGVVRVNGGITLTLRRVA